MMGTMKSATRTQLPSTEQLTLLPTTSTPARFRLSKDTRERGLRHVAEIRQMLSARSESASSALPRRDQAA
jgi:hypothetical protein